MALQLFTEDFLPLILLFAVSLTGLLLTVSYTWLKGYGYEFLAITHAATVILTLPLVASYIADKKVPRVLAFGLASLFMAGLAVRAMTTGQV